MRSPPSSYPLADSIIYSIFIMWLSIILASCKWPHPGYSGILEMTRLWMFIIIIIIMYCVLLYSATCAPLSCKSSANYMDRACLSDVQEDTTFQNDGRTSTLDVYNNDVSRWPRFGCTTASPDELRCHWLLTIEDTCDNINCVSSVFWNINVIFCITDIHGTADSITWVLSNLVDIIMLSPSCF